MPDKSIWKFVKLDDISKNYDKKTKIPY